MASMSQSSSTSSMNELTDSGSTGGGDKSGSPQLSKRINVGTCTYRILYAARKRQSSTDSSCFKYVIDLVSRIYT